MRWPAIHIKNYKMGEEVLAWGYASGRKVYDKVSIQQALATKYIFDGAGCLYFPIKSDQSITNNIYYTKVEKTLLGSLVFVNSLAHLKDYIAKHE